ncbi:MAG: GGDEF domain-containing protein, partial [candidate division Zixibacteria bacterium]|nr:GGDEF domain-containing protein [candidate division Zixibacteria bacterium]
LLVASLAHSLSAAYHIKWHESRYSNLEKKFETDSLKREKKSPQETSPGLVSEDLLSLAKIRNSDKLLKAVMEPLSKRLGTSKVVLAHISGKNNSTGLQRPHKTKDSISTPVDSVLENLMKIVKGKSPKPLNEINSQNDALSGWLEEVQSSGFTHALQFDLDPSQKSVLLWECRGQSGQAETQLIQFKAYASDLMTTAKAYEAAEELSFTDALTGLANQRYLYKRLREEISRAKRFKRHLAFVLFDLDELKTVNDTFGHQAGDAVLRQVGQSLKKSIRGIDIIARYGGDEFCVIMPEADSQTCAKFMDRILKTIAKTKIMLENSSEPLYCTVSLGGAVFPIHASDGKSLVYKADMALLRAKNSGRNRYIMYTAESSENIS